MTNTIIVKSATGRDIVARLLRPGTPYGLNDCLKWGEDCGQGICDPIFRKKYQEENGQKLGIEFTDITGGKHIFTGGRYYLETLLDGDQGLSLNGNSWDWTIPADQMQVVRAWAKRHI